MTGVDRRATPRDPAEVRRLLASIVEHSDDAIYGKDLNGIVTSWNASSQRVYGYRAEEILGRSVTLLIPPEYHDDLPDLLRRLRRGEGLQHFETVRVRRDGRRIPVSLTISPIRDDAGGIIGASTIARDISQRRLDESRWRLLAEFGDTLSGILEVDRLLIDIAELLVREVADYCVTYRVDGDAIRRIGMAHRNPADLATIRQLAELPPPQIDDATGVGTVVRTGESALTAEILPQDLLRAAGSDGGYLKTLRLLKPVSSIMIPLGTPGRVIGAITLATTHISERRYTSRDLAFVSELADRAGLALENARLYQASQKELARREAAEESLRRRYEEQRILYQITDAVSRASDLAAIYAKVVEGLRDALDVDRCSILLSDSDETLRFKAWSGLSDGYRAAVEGKIPWKPNSRDPQPVLIPDVAAAEGYDPELRSAAMAEGIRGMAFVPLVFRGKLLGKIGMYFDEPRPLLDTEIELARTIGGTVGFAITKVRDEQSVREAKESAERASEAKSQFLGIMSHELRTPLNAVLGYGDLLLLETKGPLTDGQREQVARIKSSASHQLELVNELLTYTRLEAGREEARMVDVDARRIVTDVIEFVRPQAEAKGLQLRARLSGTPLPIHTDPAKLRQVALNLAGNATKYTESGEVTIRSWCDDDYFYFEVEDTGPGIPPDMLDFIFEPFAQVDQSRTRQAGGTGLGLAIARQFADLLNGEVMVRSELGVGSTFTLILRCSGTGDPDNTAQT